MRITKEEIKKITILGIPVKESVRISLSTKNFGIVEETIRWLGGLVLIVDKYKLRR